MQSSQAAVSASPSHSVDGEDGDPAPIYTATARRLHWWTATLVAIQIPIGLYMANQNNALNIPDGTLGKLFSTISSLGLRSSFLWSRDLLIGFRTAGRRTSSPSPGGRKSHHTSITGVSTFCSFWYHSADSLAFYFTHRSKSLV
jgi:hypothetical protein